MKFHLPSRPATVGAALLAMLAGCLTLAGQALAQAQPAGEQDAAPQESPAGSQGNAQQQPTESAAAVDDGHEDALHDHYRPHFRPTLGVVVSQVSGPLAAHVPVFDGRPGFGLVVHYVAPESPAARAGIERHDILAAIGNQRLYSVTQYYRILNQLRPGQKVKVQLIEPGNNGRLTTKELTVGYAEPLGGSGLDPAQFNPQGTPQGMSGGGRGNLPGFGSTGLYVYPPPQDWRVWGYRSGDDPVQGEPANYFNTENPANEPEVFPD